VTDVLDGPDTPDVPVGRGDGDDVGDANEAVEAPGRGRVGLAVSVVVALLAVAFVVVLATREPATERRAESPLVGEIAPALSGATMDSGTFDIDDYQDRFVVVNFFASWCQPCRQEHPELVDFDEAHRAAGDAVVVSVVYDDRPENVRDFFADRGGEWPVILDGGSAPVDYGVIKVPETYLVAPGGLVVQKYTGGVTQRMIERDITAVREIAAGGSAQGGGS
jgi:cytochrome c biogenesis protein CcmG, thiol:disulfide interchange protein DsbE